MRWEKGRRGGREKGLERERTDFQKLCAMFHFSVAPAVKWSGAEKTEKMAV